MKTSQMMNLTAATVRVDCGCIGMLRPEGCRAGQYPTASVKILVPCKGTSPIHRVRVSPEVTERFLPEYVQVVEVEEVTGHAQADIDA